jgi:hypothetical protein
MSDQITHEQIVTDLKQKIAKAEGRREKIATERQSLGFSVHVEHNKSARAKLEQLNLESAALEGEIQSLNGALGVATGNLETARAAARREADEAQARQVLDLADQFDEQVRKLSEASDALVEASNAIAKLHSAMSQLGAARPTRAQIDAVAGRAMITAVMATPLQQQFGAKFLAPDERRKFADLLNYSQIIRTDAQQRLSENKKDEAA